MEKGVFHCALSVGSLRWVVVGIGFAGDWVDLQFVSWIFCVVVLTVLICPGMLLDTVC